MFQVECFQIFFVAFVVHATLLTAVIVFLVAVLPAPLAPIPSKLLILRVLGCVDQRIQSRIHDDHQTANQVEIVIQLDVYFSAVLKQC